MDVNQWFLSLPEGRQKALRDDKRLLAQAAADAATPEWTPCSDWGLLPDGQWRVRIDNKRKPYYAATVCTNRRGKHVIVGGNFRFDMGGLLAYAPFGK